MSKYCSDIKCVFYQHFPDGVKGFTAEVCPFCSKNSLIGKKPLSPVEQIPEPSVLSLPSIGSDGDLLIVNDFALDSPISPPHRPNSIPTDNVIVTFYTAILLGYFKSAHISLQFSNSQQIECLVDSLEFKCVESKEYESNDYALLRNSIRIPIKILNSCGVKGKETLVLPYKYLINGQEEILCSEKGATHRALVLHSSNFSLPNCIDKYDTLILPPNLAVEDKHFYNNMKLSWEIIFNLFSPNLSLSKEGKLLAFERIKEDLEAILHSLCYSFVCKQSKLSLFTKMEHFYDHTTKEDVSTIMCKLLLNWIDKAIETEFPFHIKFYLTFLCLDNDLMRDYTGEIYSMVFHNISCESVMSIIQEESKINLFLEYQTQLSSSPQLLHSAMSRVSELDTDSLILFLPLYHLLFNSKQDFEQAHSTHCFLDNAYWGLPNGIQFKHNPNIELTKILNAISQLNAISPILIYSITLLYFRLDLFSQLTGLNGIPFLPFLSVLLYRIEKWSLLREDTELRESVLNSFLTQSVQTPNMMTREHVCQASDIIFQIFLLIMGSQSIPKLSFKEACLLLQVLARLLTIYDGNKDLFSEEKLHESQSNIFNLVSTSALLGSIKECVDENKLDQLPRCNNECIDEVNVWNALCCIEFPPSYGWVQSVRKEFSKRLKYHSLHCLLKLVSHLCLSLPESEFERVRERETVLIDVKMELMQIAEQSETPKADYEMIIQSLLEIPENTLYNIIDLLAKILVLHRVDINGANPVEHILSVSWYPALFNLWNLNLFKNIEFPEAQSLLSTCVHTVRKLDKEFETLTISVNDLKLVIKYRSTYLLLLESLPVAANIASVVWDQTTFNSHLELLESVLNYFLRQHKLIGDLKRLLDSTNSGIYSTELADFLKIDYDSKPISFLCTSPEDNKFVLIPSDNNFESLNVPKVRIMLYSFSDLVQSQYFQSQFQHNISFHLESTNNSFAINLDIIYGKLWLPALRTVSIALSSIFEMTIELISIEQYFGIYRNCPDQINDEIFHLLPILDIIGEDYNKAIVKESVDKVICYFRLKTNETLVSHILQVKNAYSFTGQFSNMESIYNILKNISDNQLSSITPELLSTTSTLSYLTELHLEILQTLLDCVELFKWTATVLTKSSDLDSFIDLALNSVDSTCFMVNRITSFKDVCTIFMPFILEVQFIDQHCFLEKLNLVYDCLQLTDDFHGFLKTSRYCAKESELEFWKELKQSHTSIGGKIISQLKQIMQSGKFILSTGPNTKTINDILKLYVCANVLTQTNQNYSLEVLREIQSNIILITPLMYEDKDSAKFIAILEELIILADLFLQMHINGNVFFRDLTHEYTCHSIDIVKQDVVFLRKECKRWTAELVEARVNNNLLNYFTASQLVTIQVGLHNMNKGKDLNRDTFHLLSLVREQLSQQDIEIAFSGVKKVSSSPSNSFNSPELSVDFIDTSSNRAGSLSQDTHSLSLSSHLTDDEDEITETSILDLYRASKITIYSLKDVAQFLDYLCPEKISGETLQYSVLKDHVPNLIFDEKSNLLLYVLSLYLLTYSRSDFPSNHEVLICSKDTTIEEIDIFWRRALNSLSSSEIFCLVFIENLKYEIATQSVATLEEYLQVMEKGRKFRLILLCSIESEQSSYMATALAQYRRLRTQLSDSKILKECVFQRINHIRSSTNGAPYFPNRPSSVIDPNKSCVRIISSEFASSGKSLTVLRLEEDLRKIANVPTSATMCTTVNVYESGDCEHNATNKLIECPAYCNMYGHICHIDITATSYEELIPFLFKVLITGVISNKYGKIWRCSKRDYYVIEITLSSQSPELLNFLALFPDWQCLTPCLTLKHLKIQKVPPIHTQIFSFDKKAMESPEYQRVYAYLHKLESKQKSQSIEAYSYRETDPQCDNPVELLSVLMKYCSIDDPSWSVLKHFIFFLNNQLVACEKNIYCGIMVTVDKSWKGFKTFLVDCMILMSRDFTTPSLRNCLEGAPTDIIQGYSVEPRRKWEEKNHPYIFLNEDRQTMSFFGIYITENLEQLDSFDVKRVIGKKVFPKELYRILKLNKAEMEQDCSFWDRNKMISILSNVMDNSSIPLTDVDPCYVLTIDNLKKMLAIHMRFRCNIPVILMGETGCGKTRLINFMCKLQAKRRDIENLVVLKVHGETTRQDILRSYEKALGLARKNVDHDVDTILFFDEANTSHTIGLIKEILCDGRIDGDHIPTDIRLQFIAACNPYREHSPEMKNKLASAGLGMITGDKLTREHFGDIPLRDLVYRVIPLPQSLLPLVWDFGTLSSETENAYITEIISYYFTGGSFKCHLHLFCSAVAKVLSAVQKYMRERKDECSFVSLRDVERTVRVLLWFYQLIPKLRIEPTNNSLVTCSLILSVSVCYRAKLKHRFEFDCYLIANLESPLISITEASIIGKEIDRCQTRIVDLMKIPDHIARNAALKENLFMMYVCIQLKIPLFIIGKPGSSKSLARSIINHSINDGILVGGNKIAEYTRVYMQCYQCSQYTTSKEISGLFVKCQTIQKGASSDSVACVVLDEVGLAEDSPNLPLKVLHSLLEDSATSEFEQMGPKVAFIGLSNWALDPAKMNRGIMVQLEDPSIDELVNTAHAIIKPSGEVDDILSERLLLYVRSLAEGYLELSLRQNQLLSKDYFGLRDFYCLIKMLYRLSKEYESPLNIRIMIHAVKRNFGGIRNINVVKVFNESLTGIPDSGMGPLSDPLSLIRASLDLPLNSKSVGDDSSFDRSRYLLLLTDSIVSLDILFQSKILNKDAKIMFGSSFPLDKESFNICHSISRIKIHMELGHVVVLTNLSNLYESLYELLNQFYVRLLGKNWVTIGIGSQRVECPVHPNFRLIVVANKTTVFDQFPPPLINRLEKHILTSTFLTGNLVVKEIVSRLSKWIRGFITLYEVTRNYKLNEFFIGFQEDTLSFIASSTINKLSFKELDSENKEKILDQCKLELLKLASPDSILRLPRSSLSFESDSIFNIYSNLKLFSLSHYLKQLFGDQSHRGESPNLSFITTRSQLLTQTDISELTNIFVSNCKVHFNILNLYLSQFKTEMEFVSCIRDAISSQPPDTDDRTVLLIQSTDCNTNCDLISCAKYKVMEIIGETKLNSNFCFIFIARLLITEENSSIAGFCGFPWDSVHIDELRHPSHNLLPSLDVIQHKSVADIFDFNYSLPEEYFLYSNEDIYYFKRRRLLRCVQAAVSKLIQPRQCSSEWKNNKISRLSLLLSDDKFSDLADILCGKISRLLRQIALPEYSSTWSLLSSLRADNLTNYPTVMKTLSHYIDTAIEPILAGVLGVIDSHSDLYLAYSNEAEIREILKILFQDDSLFDFNSLISPESLRNPTSYTTEYLRNTPVFATSFPFFLTVYRQVTRLYQELLNVHTGKYQFWKRLKAVFDESFVGQAINSIKIKTYSNPFYIHYNYLKSFVMLQMPQYNDQLFKVIYVMLVVAISNCQRELNGEESTTVNPECLPEVTIPLIHIAYEIIRERISFVKEAYSLGFSLPSGHLIRTHEALSNPKTYSKLKYLDFDLFASIINTCSKKISRIYTQPDTTVPVEYFHDCKSLIEHNIIFDNDLRNILGPLRCSWYATHTVMLFATNIIENTEFQVLLASQDLLKTSLSSLQKIVSNENVDFQSPETVKSILDLLNLMNIRAGKSTSNDEESRKLWISFQIHITRFFHQFLTNIVLRAAVKKLPDDLIKEIIDLALLNKRDITNTRGLNLFRLSHLHPSPEFRCILLGLVFRESERNQSTDVIRKQLEKLMEDFYKTTNLKQATRRDEIVTIALQSLENTHHHRVAGYLTFDDQLDYIRQLLNDESLYPPLSDFSVSLKLIESVATLRFVITSLMKWYSVDYKTSYLRSQVTSSPVKINNSIRELNKCFYLLKTMIGRYSLHYSLLFLLKTLHFNTGYGAVLSHYLYRDNESQSIPGKLHDKMYIDLFHAIDPNYGEVLNLLSNDSKKAPEKQLSSWMEKKSYVHSVLFAIYGMSCAHYMSADVSPQELSSIAQFQRKNFNDPLGLTGIQKRKWIQLLPPDLKELVDGLSQNKFLNMSKFHISEKTHLNTIFIAGLLCHTAVLLHYAQDNEFLKPLTLIHYDPSTLKGRYLPAVPHELPSATGQHSPTKYYHSVQPTRPNAPDVYRTTNNNIIHALGDPLKRTGVPTGIRRLSAISVALLRSIMHCIFTYTLQTKNMEYPTKVTQLVEPIGRHSCSEYFFLHLIQDITDVTTITNKTFEEAVLIIHTLIDQLINIRDTATTAPTCLITEEDLEKWENTFENSHMSRLEILNDQVLREKMRIVLSQNCDVTLLRGFYEEGETSFQSQLWRHRNIIGYDHLLQVFSCQFSSSNYPLLEKFLNEQPLLSVTKYIPEFVSLQTKLVQKGLTCFKDKKARSLWDFLEIIQRETNIEYQEYSDQFTSLRKASIQLMKEKHKLDSYYPQMCSVYEITNANTLISQLVSTSQQSVGVLSSLIQLLVEIHNSFVNKYRGTFPNKQFRYKSSIPLSLVTSHHLIDYQPHLENIILSNASHSFLMGEGTLITYDFKGIEKDFANRIMLSKLPIEDDLKVDHSEGKLLYNLKRLELNIPQERVTKDDWNSIKAELIGSGERLGTVGDATNYTERGTLDSSDITEMLATLELVINFASYGKERPQKPIKYYMHEVLMYPNSKDLISKKADETCSLKHLLSLWHNLSIHRVKLPLRYNMFTNVDSCYSAGLDSTHISALKSGVDTSNIDDVLTILYDYILFSLCDQQDRYTPHPHEKLRDSLLNFSSQNLFLTHGNTNDYKLLPECISVAHTMTTWTHLVLYSKELKA